MSTKHEYTQIKPIPEGVIMSFEEASIELFKQLVEQVSGKAEEKQSND